MIKKHTTRIRLLAAAFVCLSSPFAAAADFGKAEWIWAAEYQAGKAPGTLVYFRRQFDVADPSGAKLHITCDNSYVVFINGKKVAADGDWFGAETHDISKALKAGSNTIAVEGGNEGPGAAGLIARIELKAKDKKTADVITGASWRCSIAKADGWEAVAFDDAAWKPARSLGKYGVGPWGLQATGGQRNTVEATPGKQPISLVDDLKLLPGFQAELLYTVPKSQQGSWVSMANDPKGRLIVCDQGGGLYRISTDKTTTNVDPLKSPMRGAHGMLYAFDSLYVMGNGPQGTGFYRLQDTTGDDQYDYVKLLKKLAVGGEHHAHAIVLGPDNKLYIVAGNHTPVPEGIDGEQPFQNYADDWLLPELPPPSGHAGSIKPPGGYILRTDENGTEWQMICGGFRNPYDIAFNTQGELFAYDSDMEYDSGTTWYRPTRLNHVISGAEFGWRRGAAKWPAYYADTIGSVIDIGQGCPTGVIFGYGAKFPAKYQNAIYLNDWTYGRIRAVHLQPQGASYTATAEDFVVGRPLPLTDSVIGQDGAMYFLVGGRGTQSKLFRVTYVGDESTDTADAADTDQAAAARQRRKKLETLHANTGQAAVDFAWPFLDSPDRAIRHAARIAVEHQDAKLWQGRVLKERRSQALITGTVALARYGDKSLRNEALDRLMSLDLAGLPSGQTTDALRAAALLFIRMGAPDEKMASAVRTKLEPLYPADEESVNHELARLLVYLGSDQVVAKSVALMRASRLQEDQMFYAYILRDVKEGWSIADRREYFTWLNKARFSLRGGQPFDAGGYFNYSGGRSFRPYNNVIREASLKTLSDAEKKNAELAAIINATEPPAETSDFVLQLQRQPNVWSVSDLAADLEQVKSGRSFKIGRAAYEAVQCAKCHKLGTFRGDVNLGPDLDTAASRYSPKDLLESIIEPSKVISDQIADRYVFTEDGLFYQGTIVEENDDIVVIKPEPGKSATVTIKKAEIEERGISKISRMPKGLLDPLTKEQILDLAAYILSAGDPDHAAFKSD